MHATIQSRTFVFSTAVQKRKHYNIQAYNLYVVLYGCETLAVEFSCECGNEPSGSIKCWEVLEWLHDWWRLE
jgi:hypothetical protein